jgi:hypothetical protein
MTFDDRTEERHPAYGLVSFSRVSGGSGKLFGSSVDNLNFIRLRVCRAVRYHDLSHDWYSSAGGRDLIEVDLSAAQFATLLTTMNVGEGTPCTIRYLDGKKVDDLPPEKMEAHRIQDGFKEQMQEMTKELDAQRTQLNAILDKKNVNMGDREQIRSAVDRIFMEIKQNIPFVLEQFNESAEKIVTQAKTEVDAFVTTMVHRTGLEALAGKGPTTTQLLDKT